MKNTNEEIKKGASKNEAKNKVKAIREMLDFFGGNRQ